MPYHKLHSIDTLVSFSISRSSALPKRFNLFFGYTIGVRMQIHADVYDRASYAVRFEKVAVEIKDATATRAKV